MTGLSTLPIEHAGRTTNVQSRHRSDGKAQNNRPCNCTMSTLLPDVIADRSATGHMLYGRQEWPRRNDEVAKTLIVLPHLVHRRRQ